MHTALDAILEIFTWVGLGAGLVLGILTLIIWAVDGSWLPARGVVDHEDDRTVVRWFDDDGTVNGVVTAPADAEKLDGVSMTDIWYRYGSRDRMRLTKHSPAVRTAGWLAIGLAAMGIVAAAASWIVLFVKG